MKSNSGKIELLLLELQFSYKTDPISLPILIIKLVQNCSKFYPRSTICSDHNHSNLCTYLVILD